MIDCHTHILPGIDDGSRNREMTAQMMQQETEMGVERIIATPHFYASEVSMSKFLEHRAFSYEEKFLPMLEAHREWPRLILGAEVYYFPGMGLAEETTKLCIEGTNCILVEMPFAQWTGEMVDEVETLIRKRNLTVVLAHIERYFDFQKDKRAWDRMFSLPVIPQMNAGPFVPGGMFDFKRNKRSKLCLKLLETYGPALLGSDCHNLESRKPNLDLGREVIKAQLGTEMLTRIDALSADILLKGREA